MKKFIKWLGLLVVLIILVSLFFYVKEKKSLPIISSDELLQKALIEIRVHHNYAKAISLARQALNISPNYTDIQVTMGRAHLLSGNLDSAKLYLEMAVAKDKKHPEALQYLANVSIQQKDTIASLQYLTRYLNNHASDTVLWLKKYLLLLQHRDYANADLTYKFFVSHFQPDTIRKISFYYWQSTAAMQRKAGELKSAYSSYQKAFRYSSGDPETLQQLVNLSMENGKYLAAERYNHVLLKQDSSNRIYLSNAAVIYTALHNPALAAHFADKILLMNPADKAARKTLVDLYLSLAKKEAAQNKIKYARMALQTEPGQKDALVYIINGYLDLHQYPEALEMTNRALSYYPNDTVFIDKKIGILYDIKNYAAGAAYLETILSKNPDNHYIKAFDDLTFMTATGYIRNGKWEEALTAIQKALFYHSNNKALLEQLINVYTFLNRTTEAMAIVNQLIALDPGNASYLLKKAGLLEKQQRFEEAADITYALTIQYPNVPVYKQAYLDELGNAEKLQLMQQQWDKVIHIYNRATATGGPGYFAILYALTAYTQKMDYAHTLALTDTALSLYPNDSLFLVKRSLANTSLTRFPDALTISRSLLTRYPSDTSLQKMYLDQLYTTGKYYEKENNDTAIATFLTAFAFSPKDTFALQNLSAIYFVKKQYDSSIYYANLGLQLDSNNEYLLMKKASAYEQLKDYKNAYISAVHVVELHPSKKMMDYAAYLKNKTYRNQFGLAHLQSFFSSPSQYASVTSIQYMRRFTNGSVTAKLNMGTRPPGTGIQAGIDAYYTHNKLYYSNAFANWSPGKAFPYWQAGYSLFRTFKKGWEGELGARYLDFDSVHNYTAVVSAGKYIHSTWLNLRGFYTNDTKKWYQSYVLTTRQYLNDKNDYLSAIIGLGGIPDDQSLNYNLSRYAGFVSKTFGLGFQKSFRYKTILNASFNYTNLQLTPTKMLRQYDIYLTLLRNF